MRVLLNKPIHPAALDKLQESAQVLEAYAATHDQIVPLLHDVDAILLSAGLTIGPQEMDLAPRLKVIGRHGVGLDNVDVKAATERGLPVVYTPYGPTESTAEHALLLILAAARRLPLLDRATRAGNFRIRNHPQTMGVELKGKALGVVGFGRIGRRLAEMCRAALGMTVYVHDPYIDPRAVEDWGATPVRDLVDLAGKVDVLSLHIPATPATHHLIDGQVLQAMKPRAILVNAARGTVVDHSALVDALQSGRLYAAGVDVYDPEPPSAEDPLFGLDSVVLTPHVASRTEEGRKLMGITVVKDILRVLGGERPEYLANPKVWTG